MRRFFIHCSTYWCGTDNTFRVLAKSEEYLDDLAFHLAYDNFMNYCSISDILEDLGYDTDELTDDEIDDIINNIDEDQYYCYSIEECQDDEEWDSYGDDFIYKIEEQ